MDDFRTSSATATSATRRHLESAPAWARTAIDTERERRGLPVLFGRAASTTKAALPARRPLVARTLVGAAAPGVSSPHRIDVKGDREILPEFIARSAWDCVAADLLMGETFDFRTNHDGKPFARSDDPEVSIEFDPIAGLLFTISGAAAGGFSWPAGGYASIGFVARAWTKVFTRHGWARRIDRMALRHVALLPPHHAGPAYRLARVLSVPPDQAVRTFVRLRTDTRLATKEAR
jgi:hypothetical protein